MTFYIGLVDKSADGFGIWFPDLPGCTSAGTTMDKVFANGIEAIRLWAQDAIAGGEIVPAPRSFGELREDEAVMATARQDEAVFVQVPLLIDGGRSVRANISIDARLLETIDAAAERLKVTRSTFLASAAREKIERGA